MDDYDYLEKAMALGPPEQRQANALIDIAQSLRIIRKAYEAVNYTTTEVPFW